MISCGSSPAAFLGLCLPATFSGHLWVHRTSSPPASVAPAEHHFVLAAFPSLYPTCSIQLHVGTSPHFVVCSGAASPSPGATIPVDGIKDSSFLCWIQLQGLLSHSSSPHSPISQQLWSRYSCKRSNLCIAFLLLHCYVPCHTCPAFHPAAGTGCFLCSPLAIQP